MKVDPEIVGNRGEPGFRSWNSFDCLLYAIAVGAGSPNPFEELEFTAENAIGLQQRALPSMIGVLRAGTEPDMGDLDGHAFLHAEQSFILHRPLAPKGRLRGVTEVSDVWDKGSGALIVRKTTLVDETDGQDLATIHDSIFVRGAGGFGGPKQPGQPWALPDTPPDHEIEYVTRSDQALLYRLTGDRNPLHADPTFARDAGFERPILHGMCTFGFTGRALLHAVANGDPDRFESMSARFTSTVNPGDSLIVSIWVDGRSAQFQTRTQDGVVALDRGCMTLRDAASPGPSTPTPGRDEISMQRSFA